MLKKIWKFLVDSVTPRRQVYEPKVIVKEFCWKHEKFKKGCPLCRNLNAQ